MRTFSLLCSACLLSACGLFNASETNPNIAYKQAQDESLLEVPPQIGTDERTEVMRVPSAGTGKISNNMLLPQLDDVRWVRAGEARWLELNTNAEELWPLLRDFFAQQGLLVARDEPLTGILESAWAERQEALPQTGLRGWLRGAVSTLYSATELDKYRIRLERLPNASGVRLFLQHRGVAENNKRTPASDESETLWQARPGNDLFETEMLARLLVFLGVQEQRARGILSETEATNLTAAADLETSAEGDVTIILHEAFYTAWQRTEEALDAIGMDINNSLRDDKRFDVTFSGEVAPEIAAQFESKKTLIERWFSSANSVQRDYQIYLLEEPGSTRIRIADASGEQRSAELEAEIMRRLYAELK